MDVGSARLMVLVIMKRPTCSVAGEAYIQGVAGDMEQRNLQNNIVGQEASRLFARSEINMGVDAFRDSLYAMLKRNTFLNIKFENMLILGRDESDRSSFIVGRMGKNNTSSFLLVRGTNID